MTAYVDTSWLVAMAFDEPRAEELVEMTRRYQVLLASHLAEAELASAHARQGESVPDRFLEGLDWVQPTRRLTPEITRALELGHLRGADLLHVATALYAAESPGDVSFLTLDERQREVAAGLGFHTPA